MAPTQPTSQLPPLRCISPESPLTSSLQLATSTIDELTVALANFSRVPSPEPSPTSIIICCCGSDDCDNSKTWLALRNKLESRLTLSAEVGQALLKRHEAYIRRTEAQQRTSRVQVEALKQDTPIMETPIVGDQYDDLLEERASLQKRLNQALVDNEIAEASNKTILLELQEAQEVISRLSTSNARSIGWESRLAAVIQEKEDMQQERDSEAQKVKIAEARINALKERTGKLQAEVRRLQMDLEQRRIYRLESSDHILKEARTRLESLNRSHIGQSAETERTELTAVLQSLVIDNEALKRDVGELQDLLTQSREEYNELQQEAEEQRASLTSRPQSSLRRGHMYASSVSSLSPAPKEQHRRRVPSVDQRTRYNFTEPISPATTNRTPRSPSVLSPTASSIDLPLAPLTPQHSNPPAYMGLDDIEPSQSDALEHARTRKPLLLLTRSRGIQTEPQLPSYAPSPFLSHSPYGAHSHSESSSLSESQSHSPMSTLVDRISGLLARLNQADAHTLTSRLKRQHIQGADVAHISHSTINAILSELATLRVAYRNLLEDESAVTACTRKELRGLFKFFREAFASLAELRAILNDIILDPSLASTISEKALGTSLDVKGDRSGQGWMAPISKLFGSPAAPLGDKTPTRVPGLARSKSTRTSLGPSRLVPKLEPALSATTTTVNVEFSGSGVGRSVTKADDNIPTRTHTAPSLHQEGTSTKVMDIFAGAPSRMPTQDPWVVVPRAPRKMQSIADGLRIDPSMISHQSSNNDTPQNTGVSLDDAMLPEPLSPRRHLLERTLRRRGLSDSSMRSTFVSHGGSSDITGGSVNNPDNDGQWPEHEVSMFSALTKRMFNLRVGAAIQSLSNEASSLLSSTPTPSLLAGSSSHTITQRSRGRAWNEPPETGGSSDLFVGSITDRGNVFRNRLGPM